MRHRKKKKVLDRASAQRRALLKNLATQLILYEKIKTTEAKAKALRPLVEKLISRGKKDNLANRRLVMAQLTIKKAAKKVFEVFGPKYKERAGGYLRIIKLNRRVGDNSQTAQIEFV